MGIDEESKVLRVVIMGQVDSQFFLEWRMEVNRGDSNEED